jgi:hypothetical protein
MGSVPLYNDDIFHLMQEMAGSSFSEIVDCVDKEHFLFFTTTIQ